MPKRLPAKHLKCVNCAVQAAITEPSPQLSAPPPDPMDIDPPQPPKPPPEPTPSDAPVPDAPADPTPTEPVLATPPAGRNDDSATPMEMDPFQRETNSAQAGISGSRAAVGVGGETPLSSEGGTPLGSNGVGGSSHEEAVTPVGQPIAAPPQMHTGVYLSYSLILAPQPTFHLCVICLRTKA